MSWAEISIADIGRIVTGDTPPKKNPAFYGDAYPFIKPTDMTVGQRITTNYEAGYSLEGFHKYRNKLIRAGSTAVVTIGSIGQKLTFLQNDGFVNQAVNAVIPNIDKFNDLYVYYLLKHNLGLVKQADTGASSGRENVSKSNFSALKVWACLDKNEQIRIATILDGFDSLLEVNQSRIALLEESARLLYREWFVKLRFSGHELVKMVDGVPEGWERVKVSSLLSKITKAKKIPKSEYLERGAIPCIDQGADFVGGYTSDEDAQINTPLPMIIFGDHNGVLKFINFPFAIGADGTQLIYPNTSRVSAQYFYCALKQIDLTNYFYARHFKFLKEEMVLIPSESLMRVFTEFSTSTFNQVNILRNQNQKLAEARDALLPKLMSGQLAV